MSADPQSNAAQFEESSLELGENPANGDGNELAPWRSPLARALHRNRAQPFSRYLQLATVRPDGTPANRTVVFRGFFPGTNQLMFISDRRSEKMLQIEQNPQAEACWYFTKTREQFRLAGRLTVISATTTQSSSPTQTACEARLRLWQQISDSARSQFAWPPPKGPRAEKEAFNAVELDAKRPPDTFCLVLLTVASVDRLSLRGEPQNRQIYRINNPPGARAEPQWTVLEVNP